MAITTQIPGRGYRVFHYSMMLAAAAALAVIATAVGMGMASRLAPDRRLAKVRLVSDGSAVPGASSTLTRSDVGAVYAIRLPDLPSGHVVTLRAEIFNDPGKCTHGTGGGRCGDQDLREPAVNGSVVFVAAASLGQGRSCGNVSITRCFASGEATQFSGTLAKGDTTRAVFGPGLTDPQRADVRFVILDHGVPTPGLDSEMLGTLGGGCTVPPFSAGPVGPVQCIDIQYAEHRR